MTVRNHKDALLIAGWGIWSCLLLVPFLWINREAFQPAFSSMIALFSGAWFWLMALGLGLRMMHWVGAFQDEQDHLREILSQLMLAMGVGLGAMAAVVLTIGVWIGVSPSILLMSFSMLILVVGRTWLNLLKKVGKIACHIRERKW